MNTKIITETFYKVFGGFLLSNGYERLDGFFVRQTDELFVKVYADCKQNNGSTEIDVLSLPVPFFCGISDEEADRRRMRISVSALSLGRPVSFCGEPNEEKTTAAFEELLCFFRHNYERFFAYSTLGDYTQTVSEYNSLMDYKILDIYFHVECSRSIIENLNLAELVYIYYRDGKIRQDSDLLVGALIAYREFLYLELQHSDELFSPNDSTDNSLAAKASREYEWLVRFARALVDNDVEYVSALNRRYDENAQKSIEYIKSLSVRGD